MIVITRKQSYFINDNDLSNVELGSLIFDPEVNKMYMLLSPGVLTEVGTAVESLEDLVEAIAAGGNINITNNIDAPTAFVITADTTIVNNGEITISEDTVGDGVFKATEGTLILEGKGTINGIGKNDYNMAVWATENG